MEFQTNFSNSAFGGFKKEEVIEYLANLEQQYTQEQQLQQQQIASLSAQLSELNSLVEEQYQKIVESDSCCKEYRSTLEETQKEAAVLRQKLTPLEEAAKSADEIREEAASEAAHIRADAERYALEMRQSADALRQEIEKQAEAFRTQAERESRQLVEEAQKEAELLRWNAKEKLDREQAASADKEERARRLLDAAQRQAEDILRAARYEAAEEKLRTEENLKVLDEQKTQLLQRLEEVKSIVEGVSTTPKRRTEEEIFREIRRNTTEALKRKFSQLNGKE